MGEKGKRKVKMSARQKFAMTPVARTDEEEQQAAGSDGEIQKPEVVEQPAKKRKLKGKKKSGIVEDAKPTGALGEGWQVALDYLESFRGGALTFKFSKKSQTLLLKHCYSPDMLPDSAFPIFLEYISGMKGGSREVTLKEAQHIMESFGTKPKEIEVTEAEPSTTKEVTEADEVEGDEAVDSEAQAKAERARYERAVSIARVLA